MSRLLGGLFTVATFPGVIVSGAFQRYCEGTFLPPLEELLDESALEEGGETGVDSGTDSLDHEGRETGDEVGRSRPDDEMNLDETEANTTDEWTTDGRNDIASPLTDTVPYEGLLAIAFVPFVLSTVLAVAIFLVSEGIVPEGTLEVALWWLGLSVAVHAFPNETATALLWEGSKTASTPLRYLGLPLAGLTKLALLGRFLWLDALYGLVLLVAVRELLAIV